MTTWQALATLCAARDGAGRYPTQKAITKYKSRAIRILGQIGMKKSEIYDTYPEQSVIELYAMVYDKTELLHRAREAETWMVQRN